MKGAVHAPAHCSELSAQGLSSFHPPVDRQGPIEARFPPIHPNVAPRYRPDSMLADVSLAVCKVLNLIVHGTDPVYQVSFTT